MNQAEEAIIFELWCHQWEGHKMKETLMFIGLFDQTKEKKQLSDL